MCSGSPCFSLFWLWHCDICTKDWLRNHPQSLVVDFTKLLYCFVAVFLSDCNANAFFPINCVDLDTTSCCWSSAAEHSNQAASDA